MTMKYFEIHDPYYAMIKSQDQTQAIETYVEYVSDDEEGALNDEIKEIDRDIHLSCTAAVQVKDWK